MNMRALRDKLFIKGWHPYFWILLLNYAVYLKTTVFKFTNFDDTILIVDHYPFIRDLANIPRAFCQKIFLDSSDLFYRPLLAVSLILDAQWGGISPFVYHLTNIVIHVVVAWLLFRLLLELKVARGAALLLGLIFSVHPALTPAVAWIPGRNDSLLALFILASFICFVRFIATPSRTAYLWHLVFLFLALLTKETAVMLLPVALLYIVIVERQRSVRLRALLPGWFLLSGMWIVLRLSVAGAMQKAALPGMMKDFLHGMPAFVQYLGKIVFPFHLSGIPMIQDTGFVYGTVAIVLIAALLPVVRSPQRKLFYFGLAWCFLFLLPSLAAPNNSYLEHRLYVPLIGFIFAAASAGSLTMRPTVRRGVQACGMLTVMLFAFLTFRYCDTFINGLIFWTQAIHSSPHSSKAHNALGKEYLHLKLLDRAEAEFNKSVELDPCYLDAYIDLGIVYAYKKKFVEAEKQFTLAINGAPTQYIGYLNYGQLCEYTGRMAEAVALWRKAAALDPDCSRPYEKLASYYGERGDKKLADFYLKEAVRKGYRPPAVK
jgi:hypothetical protein